QGVCELALGRHRERAPHVDWLLGRAVRRRRLSDFHTEKDLRNGQSLSSLRQGGEEDLGGHRRLWDRPYHRIRDGGEVHAEQVFRRVPLRLYDGLEGGGR